MADPTDAEFEMAEARGRKMLETEPRAVSARYDRKTGRSALAVVGRGFIRSRLGRRNLRDARLDEEGAGPAGRERWRTANRQKQLHPR